MSNRGHYHKLSIVKDRKVTRATQVIAGKVQTFKVLDTLVKVYENPTVSQVKALISSVKDDQGPAWGEGGSIRAIKHENNWWLWDASLADHTGVADQLGIPITSYNGRGNPPNSSVPYCFRFPIQDTIDSGYKYQSMRGYFAAKNSHLVDKEILFFKNPSPAELDTVIRKDTYQQARFFGMRDGLLFHLALRSC
jgi:hypothetical protein